MSGIDTQFADTPPDEVVACGCPPKGAAAGKAPKGCEYLDKPDTVEAPQSDFDRIRKPSSLDKGTATTFTFPGSTAASPATRYVATVAGRQIPIIAAAAPAGKSLPTAQQVAQSLGAVPEKQLDSIHQVVVSPNQNPSDAYWAQQYNTPGFSSAATGGSNGVTFYPSSGPYGQAFVDSTMIHEGGHTFSQSLWKDSAVQKQWTDAIAADGGAPSTYADNSPGEDFSESLVMYSLSKGTKCESTAKARYPARYAALDKMFKK